MEKMERTIPRTDRECTLNHAYQPVFHLYCKNFNKRLFFLLIKYITRYCSFIIFILTFEDRFLDSKILIKYKYEEILLPFYYLSFRLD